MFDAPPTFVDRCLAGDALLDEIDDFVDFWHDSDQPGSLAEFLGFSDQEYALWVEKPESLRFIVAARKQVKPVEEILRAANDNAYRLAARASSSKEAQDVYDWLVRTGRMNA